MDISLVDTSDLLNELLKRYDAAIFTGYRDLDAKQYDVSTITKGSSLEILGLAQFTAQHTKNAVWEDEE